MDTQYTAIVKRQGDWWIGLIEEVPGVNCQELTRKIVADASRNPPGGHRVQPPGGQSFSGD